jgi:hypothetical protein
MVTAETTTPGASIRYTTNKSEPTPGSFEYTGAIPVSTTTTFKFKAFKDGLTPSATVTASYTQAAEAVPATVAPPLLWWRADAGVPTGTGEFWLDQSGNGNHGFQTFGGAVARIVPNFLNGLPVMKFDGGDTARFTNRLTNVQTVFWVVREDPATPFADYRSLLGDDTTTHFAGGHGLPGTIWRPDGNVAAAQVRNGTLRRNGSVVIGTTTPRPTAMSILSLVTNGGSATAGKFGGGHGSPWIGDLAELIVYESALTTEQVKSVEAYLAARYGITLPLP